MKASNAVLLAFGLVLGACSENAVAPRAAAPVQPATVEGGGSSASLVSWDTLRFSITIDPSRVTTYNLGAGNSIVFPAHSLCDPTKSTYGEGEWDKPCTQATAPLTVSVKAWINKQGHPQLDFSPSVRFVPSALPTQWVVLSFGDYQASLDPMFNILYCPQPQGGCKDESKKDPTLATTRDPVTGQVTRRVKHFSGYNVAAGDSHDGYNLGANTIQFGGLSTSFVALAGGPQRSQLRQMMETGLVVRRRSGYVLASG